MNDGFAALHGGSSFDHPISMAFQPIVNVRTGKLYAQEALVRGLDGESAATVLATVTPDNRNAFNQACRLCAIDLAHHRNIVDGDTLLSINLMPNAMDDLSSCMRETVTASERAGLAPERIIFEFTETEQVETSQMVAILQAHRDTGFLTAVDDFGAGLSGLLLLTQVQPDIVKIDMGLIRGIDTDKTKQITLRHIASLLNDLGVITVCEGVETQAELEVIRSFGIDLIQGYLIARPSFGLLNCPNLNDFVA